MTLRLQPRRRIGGYRIALLCEQRSVAGHWGRDLLHVHVTKVPVAVLIATDAGLTACDLSGRPLAPEVLDTACPGLLSAMTDDDAEP